MRALFTTEMKGKVIPAGMGPEGVVGTVDPNDNRVQDSGDQEKGRRVSISFTATKAGIDQIANKDKSTLIEEVKKVESIEKGIASNMHSRIYRLARSK
jgi:hypothetical protein